MEYMQVNRANGRAANELRPVKLTRGVMKHAHGSCLAEFGDTRVLCAATIEEGVPGWRKGAKAGWVTAEYAMLPASTGKRCKREHANRKGRSMEIERLIGRSLRTVVNMKALGEYTVTVDCDVIQADGGTRTASITGAWVALHDALAMWVEAGKLERIPLTGQVAAISMGVVDGNTLLDLDYSEDSHAEVDMNLGALRPQTPQCPARFGRQGHCRAHRAPAPGPRLTCQKGTGLFWQVLSAETPIDKVDATWKGRRRRASPFYVT